MLTHQRSPPVNHCGYKKVALQNRTYRAYTGRHISSIMEIIFLPDKRDRIWRFGGFISLKLTTCLKIGSVIVVNGPAAPANSPTPSLLCPPRLPRHMPMHARLRSSCAMSLAAMGDAACIAVAAIAVPDSHARRRIDDDGLDSLARSIEDLGLLQPILVRPLGNGR
ncbi:ParB N-terminal domain-containing protein, partial [Azospirillum sp. B506]|uniref:ParB N-terminal domain-containing protein n=1 Tax=Azospirillum sp. B506 TaxID=137721 RepID=UPI0035D479C7